MRAITGTCTLMYAYWHMCTPFFMQLKLYFNACAVFSDSCLNYFEISMVEESSQPTKHANKIMVSIFLTVKAIILNSHGMIKTGMGAQLKAKGG